MLFEWTAGRNSSCSLSRSLANDSGISVDLKVLNSVEATVARFDVAPGEFFFFEVPANQVTVPMSVQLNGGPVVELLQVGPLAPCEEEPTTTTAPTTTTTARTTTTSTTRPPTTLSPITIAPTTTAVGGVDIKPAPKTLPVTGRTSRTLVVLAIGLLAGGLAYRVAGPKRYTVRRGR